MLSPRKDTHLNIPKLIALLLVLAVTATPTLSFAKASGGGSRGGGYSKGSGSSGSFGSRGTRTYDNNKFKPIERSTSPAPAAVPPAARPAAPAAPSQPASPVPFWQRHPILTGLAAGFAGSWIGHMLFGANNTLAGSGETGTTDQASDSGGSIFMFLLLMLLGAAALYYFMKVRRSPSAAPAYPGLTRNSVSQGDIEAPVTKGGFMSQPSIASSLSPVDQDKFKEILRDVQAAWSKQDLDALKRLTTPEILHYFIGALSENVSQEVENHVDDLRVLTAEVQEAWTEDDTGYATVLFGWTARDYTVSLTKQQGESGFVVDGDDRAPTETSEAWTFMRYRGGKWLLSAIQQVE
jgi:predicted lipid-binding transport protein (Tim44 family)